MSKICVICEKGRQSGNKVSHSNIKTRRAFKPNVQQIRIKRNGKVSNEYVCTRCLKAGKIERA